MLTILKMALVEEELFLYDWMHLFPCLPSRHSNTCCFRSCLYPSEQCVPPSFSHLSPIPTCFLTLIIYQPISIYRAAWHVEPSYVTLKPFCPCLPTMPIWLLVFLVTCCSSLPLMFLLHMSNLWVMFLSSNLVLLHRPLLLAQILHCTTHLNHNPVAFLLVEKINV